MLLRERMEQISVFIQVTKGLTNVFIHVKEIKTYIMTAIITHLPKIYGCHFSQFKFMV